MPTSARFQGPVLLFDADCGLCVRAVRWLLRRDRAGRLRFAPLQGRAGQDFLCQHGLPTKDFESLVYVPDWGAPSATSWHQQTDGLGRALLAVGGGPAFLARLMYLLPRGWRDRAYQAVARRRGRISLPPRLPSDSERFLP